jgi:hypothetical protein
VRAGQLYLEIANRPEEALEPLRLAVAINPGDARAQMLLTSAKNKAADINYRIGVAAFQKQDLDRAIAAWDKTLAIDPEHKNAQLNRAQALELKQNLQRLRWRLPIIVWTFRARVAAPARTLSLVWAMKAARVSSSRTRGQHALIGAIDCQRFEKGQLRVGQAIAREGGFSLRNEPINARADCGIKTCDLRFRLRIAGRERCDITPMPAGFRHDPRSIESPGFDALIGDEPRRPIERGGDRTHLRHR